MTGYFYLDVKLRLRNTEHVVITPAYFRGSIEHSLESFFGEIGGKTDIEVIKFSSSERRVILRIPEDFYQRIYTAITLIGYYQEVPCHFQLLKKSKDPLDFDADIIV